MDPKFSDFNESVMRTCIRVLNKRHNKLRNSQDSRVSDTFQIYENFCRQTFSMTEVGSDSRQCDASPVDNLRIFFTVAIGLIKSL